MRTRAHGVLLRCMEVVAALGLIILALHVVLDVTLRTLGHTMPGTLDYVTYWWMVILVALAIGVALGRNEHIIVDLVPEGAGTRPVRRVRSVFADAITLLFFAGLLLYGWHAAEASRSVGEYAHASGVSIWPARYLLPLSAGLCLLLMVLRAPSTTEHRESPL